MRPTLLQLGPFGVHAYGLALALSFLIGSLWVTRRGPARGYREEELSQLFLWILGSALIGARVYYAVQHPEDFRQDWLELFRLWRGGLTQYGGVIGALLVGWLFIRSRGWSFRAVGDLMAPVLALGEAITRIGCFLSGCCFGRACHLPWSVHYPTDSPASWALGPVAVHPSPLYLSLGNLLLFWALTRAQQAGWRSGRVLGLYLFVSSLLRFLIDYTRYYTTGDHLTIVGLRMAHSQWIGLLFIAAAAAFWFLAPHAVAARAGEARRPRS